MLSLVFMNNKSMSAKMLLGKKLKTQHERKREKNHETFSNPSCELSCCGCNVEGRLRSTKME
jgi:hypothetical protein